MVADGAVPNTKTFTALIGSFGKMGSVGAALDIITELLGHNQGMAASASTYAALMAACEKAGQGDLALALFEKMKAQVHILLYTLTLLEAYEETFAALSCVLADCRPTVHFRFMRPVKYASRVCKNARLP